MNLFPNYGPNTRVWFIIRDDEDGKPTIKSGLVETAVLTTYVNKESITHAVYYIIECAEEEYLKSTIELQANRVYGSKAEAEKHMPQSINK